MFVVNAVTVAVLGPVAPILWIIWAFAYNKLYIKDLMEKGYSGATAEDDSIIRSYVA